MSSYRLLSVEPGVLVLFTLTVVLVGVKPVALLTDAFVTLVVWLLLFRKFNEYPPLVLVTLNPPDAWVGGR